MGKIEGHPAYFEREPYHKEYCFGRIKKNHKGLQNPKHTLIPKWMDNLLIEQHNHKFKKTPQNRLKRKKTLSRRKDEPKKP